jgi:hypothetical protein
MSDRSKLIQEEAPSVEEHDRVFNHADLRGLHVAIDRLQRFAEQRERRGIDCTSARELIATLRKQAASVSKDLKRLGLRIVGLLYPISLFQDAAVLIACA